MYLEYHAPCMDTARRKIWRYQRGNQKP